MSNPTLCLCLHVKISKDVGWTVVEQRCYKNQSPKWPPNTENISFGDVDVDLLWPDRYRLCYGMVEGPTLPKPGGSFVVKGFCLEKSHSVEIMLNAAFLG